MEPISFTPEVIQILKSLKEASDDELRRIVAAIILGLVVTKTFSLEEALIITKQKD